MGMWAHYRLYAGQETQWGQGSDFIRSVSEHATNGKNVRGENVENLPEPIRKTIIECEKNLDYGEAFEGATMVYYSRHLCNLDPWPDSVMQAFGQLNMDVYLTMWGPTSLRLPGS